MGIVYHGAGKFDGGFNENAYQGGQRAARELGVTVNDFEAPDPSQIIEGLRAFARNGFDLTISLGIASAGSVRAAASEFPGLKFGLTEAPAPQPNVTSLTFRQEEGAYLIGFLAASQSATGVVGFVGGMHVPLTRRYEAGYRAGALAARPGVQVIAQYLGTTPDAWNNPAKAKEVAAGMRARGADILFTAAGSSGNGVIDYVNQTQCLSAAGLPPGVIFGRRPYASVPKSARYRAACAGDTSPLFFVGVDRNQNPRGDTDGDPATLNHGLSSLLVRADRGIYTMIREARQGRLRGGTRSLGLAEGGVEYAVDRYNAALIPSALRVRLETLRGRIIRGDLKVPSQ
ncbi:nucleoside-binding protein [Deinococcus reticulitermitis]|uniref:Nucleoside-binding protein n=1 Tax=Deinococcus reticulitermitis TaxID=856736 RepID=A0A1H6ZDK7_9DEIO|nr:BMP family ABC transporter substrate-binding protein [Deinococcus reticulitermitis]SEJ50776.1 nucleoside-binding protein [Deinococcus reticulitermitis]